MIYPWQTQHWHSLSAQFKRMPHALLLAGPSGLGKIHFARQLAARLLCESPGQDGFACRKCPACHWFAGGNHPDFRSVSPAASSDEGADIEQTGTESESEETAIIEKGTKQKAKSQQIVMSQVRDLTDFLNVGTHRQGLRVILIHPLEAMNTATANALLKMLEEPAPSTVFLLVSHHPRWLLPTLRSRCQLISFSRPTQEQSLAWLSAAGVKNAVDFLAFSGGLPFAAAELASSDSEQQWRQFVRDMLALSPLNFSETAARWETWAKDDRKTDDANNRKFVLDKLMLVTWVQKWVADLLLYKMSENVSYYIGHTAALAAIAGRCSVEALLTAYKDLLKIKTVARHPLNLRLFLEDLLARYVRILSQ